MGILRTHLETECDPRLSGELAYSIKEAYRFLWELIDATPVLKNPEMHKTYGHIRQALVDVALRLVLEDSAMRADVQMISAKNNRNNGYTYTMIETKGAIISPAKTRNIKAMPKRLYIEVLLVSKINNLIYLLLRKISMSVMMPQLLHLCY